MKIDNFTFHKEQNGRAISFYWTYIRGIRKTKFTNVNKANEDLIKFYSFE